MANITKEKYISNIEKEIIDTLVKRKDILFFVIITMISILTRFSALFFKSDDMIVFLIPWFDKIRENGGINSLNQQTGNYGLLYQTIIAILTYIPVNCVILYKLFSIIFDYVLAYSVVKVVKLFYPESNRNISLIAYTVVLFAPNIILNSAVWGQCDAIYVSFCILAILALFKEKYPMAFVFLGFAFAFKLQAVFILPFFICVYLVRRRFSILYFLLSLFVFWSTGILCYIKGRPLLDSFVIYLNQADTYKGMYFFGNSFWTLLPNEFDTYSDIAMFLTVALCGLALYVILLGLKKIDSAESFINTAAWFAWTLVLFLPAMHERYTYLLDILLIILSFVNVRYIKYALISNTLTLITYGAYLSFDMIHGIPSVFGAVIYIFSWVSFTIFILKQDKVSFAAT